MADDTRGLIRWTIAMAALAVVALWAAYLARRALLLVYVSALVAIGISPLVRLIEKQRLFPIGTRRFPRWLAILTLYVIIIGGVTALALMIVPTIVDQARDLWSRLPGMLDRGQQWLIDRGWLTHRITIQEAVQRAPANGTDAAGTVLGAIWGVIGGIFGLLTILILTFYLLVEAESIFEGFTHLFPPRRRARVAGASREITVKVSAWLGGQLILGGVIGIMSAVGLGLMGVPYFYVLALIAAVGELIPVVGPILSAIPAIAVAMTDSLQLAFFVALFCIAVQQFENHLLVPKVMERQVGVSAVTVIVALLLGGSLLGLVGAVLAVPTAAILQVLFQELVKARDAE